MTKEDILGGKDQWIVDGVPFNVSTTDALKSMEQYAKQECLSFLQYIYENWRELEDGVNPENFYSNYLQSKQQ
jgi:hypothetical protein